VNANIAARLAERARLHPERLALVEHDRGTRRAVTYARLDVLAAGFARRLAGEGVGPGDRVALFVPVSIALYAALLGVFHRGATAVFVDPGMRRERVEAAVRAAAPRAFAGVLRAHLLRLLSPALRAIPHALVVARDPDRMVPAGHGGDAPAALDAGAPALVTFTTGSTGRPKAVLRTHGFLWRQHEVLARHLEVGEGTVDLPTLPVFVLHDLAAGATAVLAGLDPRRPGRVDPAAIARLIRAEGVSTALASPALADRLAVEAAPLPVRRLYTGGAPIDAALAERLSRGVEGDVTLLYGSTEAEPIAAIDAGAMLAAHAGPDAAAGGLCVGRPVPEVEVALLVPSDGPLVAGAGGLDALRARAGEPGEVAVAGSHVLAAYWNDPEADRRFKIADGARTWHRTGDAARLDTEGRLWLVGRVRERIERAGRTWWNLPVEEAARRLPGVRRAAYFPLAGAGQAVAVLALEGDEGMHAEWTLERLRAAVAPAPIDRVVARTRLPRDARHHSKHDLEALRAELGETSR
jgi:acyl-CoA synthetase (AMP-forming)/AMP-acid ligase II